ncbi:hypothetical protein ACFLY7_00305 [Patescibacteria group bacterium]
MNWATRRRLIYLSILTLVLLVILSIPMLFYFYEAPNCTDGKQNQDEQGIDCGDVCKNLCSSQVTDLNIFWSRVLKVSDGIYNAVALVENPNLNASALNVPYVFKLYDDRNILVYEREGKVSVPAHKTFPVFESSIITSERIPVRAFFEFIENPNWFVSEEKNLNLNIKNKILSGEDTKPRLEVTLENQSSSAINNLDITAIVFDINDNAIASSKTFVQLIKKNSEYPLVFTWQESFTESVAKTEIITIPRVHSTLK